MQKNSEEPDNSDKAALKPLLATRPAAKSQLWKRPQYWYPDGTVILVVGQTAVAFKLVRAWLAKRGVGVCRWTR